MSPLLLALLTLAFTSPLLWLIRPHRFRHVGWLAALPPAAVTGWLLMQLGSVAAGQIQTFTYPWVASLGLDFALRLDGLALFFGLIIVGIGTAVALYTGYYFEDEPRLGYFYGLLFFFMTSMLGLVWADNLLLLFVFWEGTSISSYLLIAFKDIDKAAQDGGRRALLVTSLGGLAMLFGMVILGSVADTYRISEIIATPSIAASPLASAALVLLLLAAFTKSAQFPFHFWLPGAMAAPTPASAYLHSATMVKAGIYLLARLHPALSEHPWWFWALLIFGATTMLVGAIQALGQYDIKALLAYATVSQLGILVMLLAFRDEAAYIAVVVGILAHALYKGPLFLIAGIIDHATGTRDLRQLANLRRELPLLTLVALLAGLSMAGLPPLFGFLSKESFLEPLRQYAEIDTIGWITYIAAALAGAFFVAYSFTLLWEAFLRAAPDAREQAAHVHHAPPFAFVLPPLLLTLIGTTIPFVLAQVEGYLFAPAASSIAGEAVPVYLALWHGFNLILLTSLAAIALGTLIFFMRTQVRRGLAASPGWLSGVRIFDSSINRIYNLATWVTRHVQGGTLAQQASVTLAAGGVVVAFALAATRGSLDFQIDLNNWPTFAETIIALLAIVAAILTVVATTRLSAIINIGVVGVAVTLFFVFHSAPDLALTQLLVDVLTVVLLVLVFYRIPPGQLPPISRLAQLRNLVISAAVGLLGFVLVLFSIGDAFFPRISDYFALNAVPLGHGGNVVNVILVDFRGFDTLGEISVLAIAAVGGYAVLRASLFRVRTPDNTTSEQGISPREAGD